MSEHIMTRGAVAVSIRAFEHAIRLGHPYLCGEHYLLALAAAAHPVGAVLRHPGDLARRIPGRPGAGAVGGGRHR